VRTAGCLIALAVAGLSCLCTAQDGSTASLAANPASGPLKIGPAAVWQIPSDFITNAHTACDKYTAPKFGDCFIAQMSKAGASSDAIQAAKMITQSTGDVGMVTAFQKAGPVDLARVEYPLRANDNWGLLVVNGDPNIIDVDDLQQLNHAQMEQAPQFQAVKERYPNADIWPGDRSGSTWPRMKQLPDGGVEIVVGYPLINGCHACAHVGLALFGWDFDAQGKFIKTAYIPVPPPPRKERRGQPPTAPPIKPQSG